VRVFVDTSAWLDAIKMRDRTPVGRVVVQLLDSGEQIYSLPLVAREILQGFKSEETGGEWRELFEGLTVLESDDEAAVWAPCFIAPCDARESTFKPLKLKSPPHTCITT
jgi:hypothetical protein